MKKLTMTLTAAALALGTLAVTANAQSQWLGAASLHAQISEGYANHYTGSLQRNNRGLWLWSWLVLAQWSAGLGVLPLLIILCEAGPPFSAALALTLCRSIPIGVLFDEAVDVLTADHREAPKAE